MQFRKILLRLTFVSAFLVTAQAQATLIEITQRHFVSSTVATDINNTSSTETDQYHFDKMDYTGSLQTAYMSYTTYPSVIDSFGSDFYTIRGLHLGAEQILTDDDGAFSASVEAEFTRTFSSNLVDYADRLILQNTLDVACSGSNTTDNFCRQTSHITQSGPEVIDFTASQLGSLFDLIGSGSFSVDFENALNYRVTTHNATTNDPDRNLGWNAQAGYLSLTYLVDIDCSLGLCPVFMESDGLIIREAESVDVPEPASWSVLLFGILALGRKQVLRRGKN
jgi:hypothetical protein